MVEDYKARHQSEDVMCSHTGRVLTMVDRQKIGARQIDIISQSGNRDGYLGALLLRHRMLEIALS